MLFTIFGHSCNFLGVGGLDAPLFFLNDRCGRYAKYSTLFAVLRPRYTPLNDLDATRTLFTFETERLDEKDAALKLHAINFSYVKSDIISFGQIKKKLIVNDLQRFRSWGLHVS